MTFHYFLLCLSLLCIRWSQASSNYHEKLLLQPLAPASLLASFNFRSNASLTSFEQQHFTLIPRSLGQILQHAKTRELHLRFSTGRWDAESWGTRPWGGMKEGGTGVELWAWVEAETEKEAFARWITLNNALSGLFCASLNFIDSTRTTRPVMTFEPVGDHSDTSRANLHLLHGTLPHEVVCTENLTPFLKLLPCKGKAGISSLLDGHKLFDASWQSMAIDVRPVCPAGQSECVVEMEQTVDMVLDIERSKRPRDNPIPRPIPREELVCDTSKEYSSQDTCYPLDVSYGQSWSLSEVFGRPIKGTCLVEASEGPDSQSVCLNVPADRDVYTSHGVTEFKEASGFSRCFVLPTTDDFELMLPKQNVQTSSPIYPPPLYAERSITGHGQERGGVQTLLTNPSPDTPVEFVYLESLPWFMKPYLHTLKVLLPGEAKQPPSIIKDIYYRPSVDRHRGTQLEIRMIVPAASTATLTYDFEKAILRYTEYPPDANRGFDVAPAVIRLVSSTSNTTGDSMYLRTTSLLLPLPTPDFSMPYNVIILTSTVMALAFGSIFNLLVRRFVGADEVEGYDIGRLRALVRGRLVMIKDRILGARNEKKIQ
ncbi:Subunit of the glycosylphosphatidylinositol transamidase complex-like protein [Xylographa soralifera]|nr:Subunit of the glycosylphosphatidylinositol transamidase complex-like protein [Xylographa soralifera]